MATGNNSKRSTFTLNTALFAVAAALLSYLCFVLFTIYRSQSDLQATHVEQLKREAEICTASVEYFFGERKEDLAEIAHSRDVSAFFENKALGMSMGYGLKLSLVQINKYFLEVIRTHKFGDDPIYSRILLIDAAGNLLADSETSKINTVPTNSWREFINPQHEKTAILARNDAKEMLASKAYFFKGKYEGQILAWIRFDKVYDNLVREYPGSKHGAYIVAGKDHIYAAGNAPIASLPPKLPDFTLMKERTAVEFTAAEGDKKKLIAVKLSVKDTPFAVINVVPAEEVYGHLASRTLLPALSIMAIMIFGGAVFVMRINMKSLVLNTRLDESAKRESEIYEKNLQLEAEIAERSRAEEALRDSEQRFRGIFENIRDVYYRADADGNLVMVSSSAKKLMGYDSTEERIGKPLISFWFYPNQRQKFLEILNDKGTVCDYEMILRKKDGTPVEVSVSSYFYFDSAGNRIGTEGIIRDITDRKRTEEQMHNAHDMLKEYSFRLEKEVRERTKDALEAQKQAESANKAKSEFLANMNHELKTPLNAVIGFSEVMLNGLCGQLTGKQAEHLDYIYRGGKHLQRLIDGILELSRIEAGKMELDPSEFIVKDVIESSLFMFSEKVKRHALELTYEIEEGLESITADPSMVNKLCAIS